MRGLVVGYNAFDVLVPVAGFPQPDSKQAVPEIVLGGGGPAATAAVALSRLGTKVQLVTPLTEDLPGRMQRQELADAGVDLSRSPIIDGHACPKAVILVDSKRQERTIFWSRGDLPSLKADQVQAQWLDEVDLMYTDGHETPAAIKLAQAARQRGLPVVMDAGGVRNGSRALVPLCTDVISSDRFARDFVGTEDPVLAVKGLQDACEGRVAMTFGRNGCLALVHGDPVVVPAFDVPVVDTTGAGDVFHAGYAYALGQGHTFLSCLEYGAAVAALKCRDWGGRRGLPTADEIEHLLATGLRNPVAGPLSGLPIWSK